MNQTLFRMLSADEQTLVLATEPKRLAPLDEDALVELHDRIRRARTKYTKLYRRQASAQVRADAARGKASTKNSRTRAKAEIFEDALARVSRRLATVARESAAALRSERLAPAGTERGRATTKRTTTKRTTTLAKQRTAKAKRPTSSASAGRRGDAALRSPASKRASAQARSATRRVQAERGSR